MGTELDIAAYSLVWRHCWADLLHIGWKKHRVGEKTPAGTLPSNCFMLIVQGKGHALLGNQRYTVDGGFVLHGGKGTSCELFAEREFDYYVLEYAVQCKHGQHGHDVLQASFGLEPTDLLALYEPMRRMHEQWQQVQPLEDIALRGRFFEWLYTLLLQLKLAVRPQADRLERVLAYMRDHYHEALTMPQLAEQAGCGLRHLNELSRQKLGSSLSHQVLVIRMEHAKQLLLETSATMQQIAERVGYATGYAFSRSFKRYAGEPPEQYRRERREGGSQAEAGMNPASKRGELFRPELALPRASRPIGAPAMPERVVVDWSLGPVLALGLTPLGAPLSLLENNRLLESYMSRKIHGIGHHSRIAAERIRELEPDLILTWNPALYPTYARIAPTTVYSRSHYSTIREAMLALGQMLHRREQAERWLDEYRQSMALMRGAVKRHSLQAQTFTLIDPNWGEEVLIVGNTDHRGGHAVYDLLGLRPAEQLRRALQSQAGDCLHVGWEQLGTYLGDRDHVLLLQSRESHALAKAPLWRQHVMKKAAGMTELKWEHYFLSDPASALLQAREIMSLMLERVK